ncbi:TetR family transcriptional regulator [Streptomyces koyangensis]
MARRTCRNDSAKRRGTRATDKRRRLTAAAAQVLHEQGVERTTLADIARAADVPVGNVYCYFETKGELVQVCAARTVRPGPAHRPTGRAARPP